MRREPRQPRRRPRTLSRLCTACCTARWGARGEPPRGSWAHPAEARRAPSLTKPLPTRTRHSPGDWATRRRSCVPRSPPWKASAGAWSGHVWAGWRHRTIHQAGTPLGSTCPALAGGGRATFGARARSRSPQPRTGHQRNPPPRRPASTTNCPWGLQRWCWPAASSNISGKERVRGQRAAETGPPRGCARGTL